MIVKNQNDILSILKMYMQNMDITQADLCRVLQQPSSAVNRTIQGKHKTNIDTLLKYIDACDAVLDINIIPNPNKGKDDNKHNK